jgi:transposase-like protein
MKQKSAPDKGPAEQVLKDIRRQTRRQYSAEEKIRIVLEGLRGEENISELCRREGIAASMYYGWSKEFLDRARSLEQLAILPKNGSRDSLNCFHSSASASQYSISEYSISVLASAARSRHIASNAANCFLNT